MTNSGAGGSAGSILFENRTVIAKGVVHSPALPSCAAGRSEKADFFPHDFLHRFDLEGDQSHHTGCSALQTLFDPRFPGLVQVGEDVDLADAAADRLPEIIVG